MLRTEDLQTEIVEWVSVLTTSSVTHFGAQAKYFHHWLSNKPILNALYKDLVQRNLFSDAQLIDYENLLENRNFLNFPNEEVEASFSYQYFNYLTRNDSYDKLVELIMFQGKNYEATRKNVIERLLLPHINYIKRKITQERLVIYLLERYKFRCEWFTKNELLKTYNNASANFEQVFEDDLRMYLFDQGIDYPFSTPRSPSGRTDIVSNLQTDDPLIVEIKVIDASKGYGKNRLKSGLSQVLKYTNDYHKEFGYLVVFNVDEAEVDIQFNDLPQSPFPAIIINGKTFYMVIVNVAPYIAASKIGKTKILDIQRNDIV